MEKIDLLKKKWQNFQDFESGYALAIWYKEQKMYQDSLEICRSLYLQNSSHNATKLLYSWNIYFLEKDVKDVIRLEKALQGIYVLMQENLGYSPFFLMLIQVFKKWETLPFIEKEKLNYWVSKIEIHTLSKKERNFQGISYPSDFEQYVVIVSKLFFMTHQYHQVIKLCDILVNATISLHYDYDIWIKRRKALALQKLGEHAQFYEIYQEVLKKKQDWFLFDELGQHFMLIKNWEEAKKNCIQAIEKQGDMTKKVNVLSNLYEIEKNFGQNKTLMILYKKWEFSLRKKMNWSVEKFQKEEWINEKFNLYEIKQSVQNYWNVGKHKEKGIIQQFLAHGKSGFIEVKKGKNYYFKTNELRTKNKKLEELIGHLVEFELIESFDKKKQKKVLEAVKINLISP